jgi:hypothetical protein
VGAGIFGILRTAGDSRNYNSGLARHALASLVCLVFLLYPEEAVKITIKMPSDSQYTRDNSKGYWFRRKLYGWGWFPVKWQGWAVTLAFIGILLLNGFYFSYNISPNSPPSVADLDFFFGIIIISVILLLWICYKTGEKPRWSWGR